MDPQRRIERFLRAAHGLAVSRLRDDPTRVEAVRLVLRRWRERAGSARADPYWNEWERLLDLPIDEFEAVICADNEHATVLRSVSPVSVLISDAERRLLLELAAKP